MGRSKNYTSIYTDEETRDTLDRLALKTGLNRSAVIRQAVMRMDKGYDAKVAKKVRELAHLTGA